jgi:hypothetical protein
LIGVQSDKYVSQILRAGYIRRENTWDNIPIINDWTDVFDEGVSKQHSNWQLYGSQKPNHEPYKLKYVYNVSVDSVDQEFEIVEELDISKYNSVEGMKKMSARNTKNVALFMKTILSMSIQSERDASQNRTPSYPTTPDRGVSLHRNIHRRSDGGSQRRRVEMFGN